jgi:histidine transport system permease protein
MLLQGYGSLILEGTLATIQLALMSMVLAVTLGLIGASAKLSKQPLLRHLAAGYTTLIRSVPDLVIMLLLFFSLQIWLNN